MPPTAMPGGSIYRVKERHLGQLKLYSELQCLTEIERKFLLALVEFCYIHKSIMDTEILAIDVTATELQSWLREKKMGSSFTIIKKRSAALTEIGLFTKEKLKRLKAKPANLFILSDAVDVIGLSSQEEQYQDHRPNRQKLNQIKSDLIEADEQILDIAQPILLARSERLWNGVLGSCMASSQQGIPKNKKFSTIYKFGSDKVEIITSSQTDSEICHVDDQRTIRAVITLVTLEIVERTALRKKNQK